ncbi:MAG: sulfotransferase [Desulfuromonas sp.]|nr:sulfotransferase [Desulfuromonas sp.]
MTDDKSPQQHAVEKLANDIDDALELLCEYRAAKEQPNGLAQNPASLLELCVELCTNYESVRPEPIRTVHHFACTGGTLICKCLAAMPNTQVLSEVDPLSRMLVHDEPRFAPTDMITLMRQSTRGVSQELLVELFLGDIEKIYRDVTRTGLRLVLRDHAHGHYCDGTTIADRPSLREVVASRFPVLSLVTVRHPLDSYLSIRANGWISFAPSTFDEYCRRYLTFMKANESLPWFKYEDFVHYPAKLMQRICDCLEMAFNGDFTELFDVISLTGDSGRSGSVIGPRPRQPVDECLLEEAESSEHYVRLLDLLEYPLHTQVETG